MKMSKALRRMTALLLVLLLAVSLVACGGKGGEDASDKTGGGTGKVEDSSGTGTAGEAAPEPVTLKIAWSGNFEMAGVQSNVIADEIKRLTGVTMDIMATDAEIVQVMLASGDLPDIMLVQKSEDMKQMIQGKLALCLEDLLKSNGADILANVPKSIEFSRKYASNGEGKVYFLYVHAYPVAGRAEISYAAGLGYFIRWDYYKEMGYPEVKSMDGFLDILADMQKKYPTNSSGKKVYAISGFNDWDNGLWCYQIPFVTPFGLTEKSAYLVTAEGEPIHRYADGSAFWAGAEFLNKANRMGLLDPDFFTMKYDNYMDKAKDGQVLTLYADWQVTECNAVFIGNETPEKGYEMIADMYPYSVAGGGVSVPHVGWDHPMLCITKSCKMPERAMDFLNFLYNYDTCRLLKSGIKGVHWDIENGKPELLDATYEALKSDDMYQDNTGFNLYEKLAGLENLAVCPDGGFVDLTRTEKAKKSKLTELDKEYCSHYGVSFPGEANAKLIEQGKVKVSKVDRMTPGYLLKPTTDEISKIDAKIIEYLSKNAAKLVLAKSDEEFKTVKAKILEDLEGLGLEESKEFWYKNWNDARAEAESITK